jgi:hypothetical protein
VSTSLAEITKLTDSAERAKRAADLVHKHTPEQQRRLHARDAHIYALVDLGDEYGTGTAIARALGANRNAYVRILNRREKAEASGWLPKVDLPQRSSAADRKVARETLLRRIEVLHKQMVGFDEKIEEARDVRDSALAELFDPTHPQYEPSNDKLAALIGVDPQHVYYMRRKDKVVRALRAFHGATGQPLTPDSYEAWRQSLEDIGDTPPWSIVQVAFRGPERAAEAARVPYVRG